MLKNNVEIIKSAGAVFIGLNELTKLIFHCRRIRANEGGATYEQRAALGILFSAAETYKRLTMVQPH